MKKVHFRLANIEIVELNQRQSNIDIFRLPILRLTVGQLYASTCRVVARTTTHV